MLAEVNNLVAVLKFPESGNTNYNSLKLGNSFNENATTKKLITLFGKTGGSILRRKTEALNTLSNGNSALNKDARFYTFILVLNKCFNSYTNEIITGYENTIKTAAENLEITTSDFNDLMSFYLSNVPYSDNNNAVYFAHKRANQLVKSRGINVHFINDKLNEVTYLKYFKNYNLFLSKTFFCFRPYNTLGEEIRIKEINIVTKRNFGTSDYKNTSFEDLKNEVEKFDPLQLIEIEETEHTPQISLDPGKGKILISGPSIPLSPTTFLEPILDWLAIYELTGKKQLDVELKFKYFNTYTTKFLVKFIKRCNAISKKGKKVILNWFYEADDDEMREFGEYLQNQFSKKRCFHIQVKDNW